MAVTDTYIPRRWQNVFDWRAIFMRATATKTKNRNRQKVCPLNDRGFEGSATTSIATTINAFWPLAVVLTETLHR
jgi:hypothetical protein